MRKESRMFARRFVLFLACVITVLLGGTGTAAAHAAPPAQAAEAESAAGCQYIVVWGWAGVFEQPTQLGGALKFKQEGALVKSPYCTPEYNGSEGEWYVPVDCTCAADGIGWMRLRGLRSA